MSSSETLQAKIANIAKIKQTAKNTVEICRQALPPLRQYAAANVSWNNKKNTINTLCNQAKTNKLASTPTASLEELQEAQEKVQEVNRTLREYTLPDYNETPDTLREGRRNTTQGGRRRSRKQKKRRSRKHRSHSRRSRK